MQKYISLNLFLFLLSFSLYSQDVQFSENYTITKGEEYERIANYTKRHFSWKNQNYIFSKTTKGFIIQRIDLNSLKEVSKTNIKNVFSQKKDIFNHKIETFEQLLQFNDKVYVFVSSRVKKNEILDVFSISLIDLKVSDRKRLVNSPKKLTKGKDRNGYHFYNFKKINTNRLIIDFVEQDKKSKQTNLVVNIFDKNLNTVSKYTIEIGNNKHIWLFDRSMDDNQNYFILGKTFTPTSIFNKKKLDEYKLILYQLSENNDNVAKANIEIDKEKVIDEAKLHLTNNNNLKVIGTLQNYAAKDGLSIGKIKGESTGLFILSMDDKLQTTNFTYHKFPIKMLEKHLNEKEVKKINQKDKSKKFDSYFKDLKIKINGNDNKNETIIIGEQQFTTTEKVRKIYFERYHFNNILAAKILPDGSLKWIHKLIKFQRGRGGKGDMSFNSLKYKDKHYIFFRDNKKNFGVKQEEIEYAYADGRGGYLVAYAIDDNSGGVIKEVIFHPEGRAPFKFLFSISERELIYEQFLEKKNRLVKISINP